MEHLLFNSCYRIETAKMYKLAKNCGMCVHLYNSYVIIWCPTLHVNQNAINLLHFQVPYPQFLSKAAGFLVCVLLKLSDYICSDGTKKYFFIIMHCGIIFSCMENIKEWPVFFSLIIHEGLLKRSSEGGQDLLPWPDYSLLQMPILMNFHILDQADAAS